MVEHIFDLVKKTFAMIHATNFIALSAYETSTMDNTKMIMIHTHVMSNWGCQSFMRALSKMESDGATLDSLIKVIIRALVVNYCLDPTTIVLKLLCFGIDCIATF